MNVGPEVHVLDNEARQGKHSLAAQALESLSRRKESAIAACGGYCAEVL